MSDYHDGYNAAWKRHWERRREDRDKFKGKSEDYRRGWLDSLSDIRADLHAKYAEFDRDPAFNVNAEPRDD